MSMSLEDLLEFNYFPYYEKEELLQEVKAWVRPELAIRYILENYDKSKERRENAHKEFEKFTNNK